jgi:nicotinate phosphoribosyltransferase
MKRSEGKGTWPGSKQVWRSHSASGDVIALENEVGPLGATPLLQPVMRQGKRFSARSSLDKIREGCLQLVRALPPQVRTLSGDGAYAVERSVALRSLAD